MKEYVLLAFFIGLMSHGFSQNINGQWKGVFLDKSTSYGGWGGDRCDYVIDLEAKGSTISGYSYTYFTDEGKNYYTICTLKGTYDKKKKYIEITEVERTKTNVPTTIRNCFQIHKLTWSKTDSSENLTGTWIPAPNQSGNCGFGATSLNRRTLKNSYPHYNAAKKTTASKPLAKNNTTPKTPVKVPAKVTAPVAKLTPKKTPEKEVTLKPNKENVAVEEPTQKPPAQKLTVAPLALQNRNNTVLKTLEVENEAVKIDLYDNGEVDGDSISVYYNNKLLLGKKRLTEKAISLTLPVADNDQVNELVMYAENLGTIPPNTALMVVTDGTKRYEVRITSDLQKSGTIRFVHKNKGK